MKRIMSNMADYAALAGVVFGIVGAVGMVAAKYADAFTVSVTVIGFAVAILVLAVKKEERTGG